MIFHTPSTARMVNSASYWLRRVWRCPQCPTEPDTVHVHSATNPPPSAGLASTADSDSGLKACLRIRGKWSAPSRKDPDAARERVRRRAHDLRGLLE